MAVAEALARGLPVISTATGAIEQLVTGSGRPAGIVLPPGDEPQLAAALSRVIGDEDVRTDLPRPLASGAAACSTWDDACERMAAALVDRAGRDR